MVGPVETWKSRFFAIGIGWWKIWTQIGDTSPAEGSSSQVEGASSDSKIGSLGEVLASFQDASASPWSFQKDKDMEAQYVKEVLESALDRIRPAFFTFVLPVVLISRCIFLMNRFFSNFMWSRAEICITGLRIFLLFFVWFLVAFRWSASQSRKVGFCFLWVIRIYFLMTVIQEGGVRQFDSQIMYMMMVVLTFAGFIVPGWGEYLCMAVTMSLAKPLSLVFSSLVIQTDPITNTINKIEDLWISLLQRAVLIVISVGVNHRVYCDRRRNWLLSPRLTSAAQPRPPPQQHAGSDAAAVGIPRRPSRVQLQSSAGSLTELDYDWDVTADSYFPPDELAELKAQIREEAAEIRRRRRRRRRRELA